MIVSPINANIIHSLNINININILLKYNTFRSALVKRGCHHIVVSTESVFTNFFTGGKSNFISLVFCYLIGKITL